MIRCNYSELQIEFRKIVQNYLLHVSSFSGQPFVKKELSARVRYFKGKGFPLLQGAKFIIDDNSNNLLEGCTRVFLINPVIDKLFEHLNIICDWHFGSTFAKYTCSNREYENDAYLEFIIEQQGKRIGYRYTPLHYSDSETTFMNRDFNYLYKSKHIPGFDRLSPINEVWVIDWSGISSDELASFQTFLSKNERSHVISAQDFFMQFFTNEEYEHFLAVLKDAVSQAQHFIGMKTIPLLLPNNLLSFKDFVLLDFDENLIESRKYEFQNSSFALVISELGDNDVCAINKAFFDREYRTALKGHSDFAKSFITSEYLFRTTNEELEIDYTSVVVGYLKSVEQLLYLIYTSAFQGRKGMEYWDSERNYNNYCSYLRKNNRAIPTLSENNKKANPYIQGKYLYRYYHFKKTGDKAPEFGELIYFLRYNDDLWNVSDSGKEFIFSCLDDYRNYCRNHHFHKDNIWSANYCIVQRIRNNTFIVLYYLLGAFKLLDRTQSEQAQLGIESYSFNYLYQEIFHYRRHLLWAKTQEGYEGLIYYIGNDHSEQYDADCRLTGIELRFIKIPSYSPDNITRSKISDLIEDRNFFNSNKLIVSQDSMLIRFTPIKHISK